MSNCSVLNRLIIALKEFDKNDHPIAPLLKLFDLSIGAIENIPYSEIDEHGYRFRFDLEHQHYLMSEGFETKLDDIIQKTIIWLEFLLEKYP
ncbi:hypothetical protein AB3N61_18340 [Leptospira sp. WS58.C1]|uniref:hypothetical protein n=1 Tax=Leptospira cinconiae TaxID=3235173 RepID=UPI00349E9704